ncbi:hypothetical protein SKAU_G00235450 [Synaphobranchus kaupii]|uniref:Uncharacterized protein n=1 Tax=Synaphobranchus kaupii TaxID=118154 RepID=A0A9Q1F6I2_SYNKA|nr:hypothetical protein SKAU_G00235450 [Synaphobranchus kaupii]
MFQSKMEMFSACLSTSRQPAALLSGLRATLPRGEPAHQHPPLPSLRTAGDVSPSLTQSPLNFHSALSGFPDPSWTPPSPLELFQLFFSESVVQTLCDNTNKNGERRKAQGKKTHWFPVSVQEMYRYRSLVVAEGSPLLSPH